MKVTYIERTAGTWRLRIETGRDGEGRRQFAYETVRGVEEDARRRRFELLQAHEQGSWAKPDRLVLREYLDKWIAQRLAIGAVSRGTAETYATLFRAYVHPTLGGLRLQALTGVHLQDLYAKLMTSPTRQRERLSSSTVRLLHRALSAALKGARKARLIIINPIDEVEPPRGLRVQPRALDDDGVDRLMRAVAGHWLEPLIILALGAGLRRGEVCGLRWQDVDLDGRRLHVRGQVVAYDGGQVEWKAPKTEAGVRKVSLPGELVDLLRGLRRTAAEEHLAAGRRLDDAYVFGKGGEPLTPDALTGAMRWHCDKHGLPEVSFHSTRHTHATALLKRVGKEGAKAVANRLGHANIAITLGTYQTVFEGDDRELADLAGGIIGRRNAT